LCRPASEVEDGKIYGVLPYVAPEVLRGEKYTQSSDIYSFGMVAYEVLTGLPPFHKRAHDLSLLQSIRDGGLRPSLNDIRVPQLLKDLIKQC